MLYQRHDDVGVSAEILSLQSDETMKRETWWGTDDSSHDSSSYFLETWNLPRRIFDFVLMFVSKKALLHGV